MRKLSIQLSICGLLLGTLSSCASTPSSSTTRTAHPPVSVSNTTNTIPASNANKRDVDTPAPHQTKQATSELPTSPVSQTMTQKVDPARVYADAEAQSVYKSWLQTSQRLAAGHNTYESRGHASWYGPGLNGNKTASGEIFDMFGQTAAHKKMPFGSIVRITNLRNQQSVIVRINDRGPFIKGRVIDLSYGAAYSIDMVRSGVEEVKIEIIRLGKK